MSKIEMVKMFTKLGSLEILTSIVQSHLTLWIRVQRVITVVEFLGVSGEIQLIFISQ